MSKPLLGAAPGDAHSEGPGESGGGGDALHLWSPPEAVTHHCRGLEPALLLIHWVASGWITVASPAKGR